MSSLKQSTLDHDINLGAIAAFVERFPARIEAIEGYAWPDNLTPKQADAIAALRRAETAMRLALDLAYEADSKAHEVWADRVYGRNVKEVVR